MPDIVRSEHNQQYRFTVAGVLKAAEHAGRKHDAVERFKRYALFAFVPPKTRPKFRSAG